MIQPSKPVNPGPTTLSTIPLVLTHYSLHPLYFPLGEDGIKLIFFLATINQMLLFAQF